MNLHRNLPFLFIHGAGGTQKKWRRLLSSRVGERSNAINLPGHGTDKGPALKSVPLYAKAIAATLTEDVVVVGHSMGGLVAAELSLLSPSVRGLVLVASHFELPVGEKLLQKLKAGQFPDSLFYASYSKTVEQSLLEEEKSEIFDNPIETTYQDYECCNRYKGRDTFSRIKVPILAVYGEEDRLLPADARETLAKLNPRVHSRTVPGSGHYIMLEKPPDLAKELEIFSDVLASKE